MIRKICTLAVALVAMVSMVLLTGCGDEINVNDNTGGDNVDRIVSLASSPSQIAYGDDCTISGLVVDTSGTGIQGRQVILSVSPTDAGYFLPAVVTTAASGAFEVTYIPLDTGAVIITAATTTNATATISKTVTVSEDYQTGAWRFEFEVTPGFALADGQDQNSVTVAVWDPDGNPAAAGVEVRLEAGERFEDVNGDGYFTENVDHVLVDINSNGIWDRVGTLPRTAITNTGQISFNYTSGTLSGLIYIRVTIIADDGVNSDEYPMVLRPSDEIASIDLTTDRSEIQVKATGGIEFANMSAVCYDAFGNRVQSELPVEFFIVYGPGGGERFTISEYDSTETSGDTIIAVTNVVGQATATLFSGIKSGTVMIQARNGSIFSNSTLININAGPAYEISVGVDPCNIRGWDVVNEQANVVAMVNDKYGNPVADTTEIFFWTDEGMVVAASVTEDGLGESIYSSGDPRGDGLAIIRAETAGGTVVDSTILIVSGPAYTVTAYGYALELNANGEDYTDIWVDARDINDNFLLDGTTVTVLLADGSILNGSLANGCYSSLARIRYKTSVLTRDYVYSVPDNGIGRVLTGNVQAGGVMGPTDGISIILHTGPSNTTKSEVKVASTAAPGSSEPVDVIIKDRAGNPLGGHLLNISANLGSVSPASGITNAYGEVSFIFTAPASIGNDYITIEDMDPGYGGMIITKKVKIDTTD